MENNEQIISQIHDYCMSRAGAYETRPFGKYPVCYRIMGKIFAQLNPESHFYKLTLKCQPKQADLYRRLYDGIVVRGYHCPPVQQPYWNTVDLDRFDDMDVLLGMIDEAYDAAFGTLPRKAKNRLCALASLEYRDTDGNDPDFAMLCGKLDQSLDVLVGTAFQRGAYEQYNQRGNISDVILVCRSGEPIACGGFKMYDEEHAELKRIYVDESCQGMGLGAELVRRLEAKAKIKDYKWCILETSEPLAAACHLYQKAGYKVIPNYGQYVGMTDSICMERKI